MHSGIAIWGHVPPPQHGEEGARPRCTTAHPLHTRFTNVFGASVSEAAVRPDPRRGPPLRRPPRHVPLQLEPVRCVLEQFGAVSNGLDQLRSGLNRSKLPLQTSSDLNPDPVNAGAHMIVEDPPQGRQMIFTDPGQW